MPFVAYIGKKSARITLHPVDIIVLILRKRNGGHRKCLRKWNHDYMRDRREDIALLNRIRMFEKRYNIIFVYRGGTTFKIKQGWWT